MLNHENLCYINIHNTKYFTLRKFIIQDNSCDYFSQIFFAFRINEVNI